MSFTDEQIAALKAPLNRAFVKERSQAGRSLSYLEGWRAIDEANRIFGFDGWNRELVTLKELGEARQVGDKWRVAYMATVRITVPTAGPHMINTIVRDGTGYGSGIDKDLGQAHESAIKEAETDAMKRALMTFGNPFGLALYDKEQRNVVDEPKTNVVPMRNESEERFDVDLRKSISLIKTSDAVTGFMLLPETQRILGLLPDVARDDIREYANERRKALRQSVREAN